MNIINRYRLIKLISKQTGRSKRWKGACCVARAVPGISRPRGQRKMLRLVSPPLVAAASTFRARGSAGLRDLQFSGRGSGGFVVGARGKERGNGRRCITGCSVLMASSDSPEAPHPKTAVHSATVALSSGETVLISGDAGLSSSEFRFPTSFSSHLTPAILGQSWGVCGR